ncbi:hypothetical protein JT102_07585, partial [Helicobacter pylori]|nr:hypothetical protein [Helicobacter pylori]
MRPPQVLPAGPKTAPPTAPPTATPIAPPTAPPTAPPKNLPNSPLASILGPAIATLAIAPH